MVRKSTTQGSGNYKGLWYSGFLALASLIPLLMSGCCPYEGQQVLPPPGSVSSISEAEFLMDQGRTKEAMELLRKSAQEADNGERCEAAFYLIFLDPGNRGFYEAIVANDHCKRRCPLNYKVLESFQRERRQNKKLKNVISTLKAKQRRCLAERERLKKEKERLKFELKKLEQIRKETEKLRLKK